MKTFFFKACLRNFVAIRTKTNFLRELSKIRKNCFLFSNGLETSKSMFSCKLKPANWWDKMKNTSFKMALKAKGGMTTNEKPLSWTNLTHQFNSWWWWWDINKSPWFSSGNCCLRLLFLYLKFIFEWKRRSCRISVAVKIRKNWTR